MYSDCFVCLNSTKNKVCTTCECYAHYHCWGKYLKNYTNVITYIYEQQILITVPLYAKCPQCSGNIANVKVVTRSDTRFGRRNFLRIRCQNMFAYADSTGDLVKRSAIFRNIFETISHNKNLLRGGGEFRKMIRIKLISLHNSGDWESANFYHLKIFGKQIK